MTYVEPPFRLEARKLATASCATFTEDEVPLAQIYKLLTVSDLEEGWILHLHQWCRDSRIPFPARDPDSGQYPFCAFTSLVPSLTPLVVEKLQMGDLVATGIGPGDELKGKRTAISPDSWRVLSPDFQSSIVRAHGRLIASDVLVARAASPVLEERKRPVSAAELTKWAQGIIEKSGTVPPIREQVRLAVEYFGDRVTRDHVRATFSLLTPPYERRQQGRPRKSSAE